MDIRRGDIIWVEFNAGNGHIQRGRRPCVVVSTNRINGHGKIINVIPGTTNLERRNNPVHLIIKDSDIHFLSQEKVHCLNGLILMQLGIKEED